jgi:hypothetical protein
MPNEYDELVRILQQGKNGFIKYSVIHEIMYRAAEGHYTPLDKNRCKGVLTEGEVDFFNQYIPALLRVAEEGEKFSVAQVRDITRVLSEVPLAFSRLFSQK